MGGSEALDPPPFIILSVSWVGLQPPLLSLVTGALSGCLLVPPSACADTMPKSPCGCGALVGASEQLPAGSYISWHVRQHQWVPCILMVSFLLYVSPFGAGMPNPGERLGFNLVCKKCSPQNYKGGGSGWVKSRVGGSKVGWVGLVQNTPPPSYKRSLAQAIALASFSSSPGYSPSLSPNANISRDLAPALASLPALAPALALTLAPVFPVFPSVTFLA